MSPVSMAATSGATRLAMSARCSARCRRTAPPRCPPRDISSRVKVCGWLMVVRRVAAFAWVVALGGLSVAPRAFWSQTLVAEPSYSPPGRGVCPGLPY